MPESERSIWERAVDDLPDRLCEHLDGPIWSGEDGKIISPKDLLKPVLCGLLPSLGHWLETSHGYSDEQSVYTALCPLAVISIGAKEVNFDKGNGGLSWTIRKIVRDCQETCRGDDARWKRFRNQPYEVFEAACTMVILELAENGFLRDRQGLAVDARSIGVDSSLSLARFNGVSKRLLEYHEFLAGVAELTPVCKPRM